MVLVYSWKCFNMEDLTELTLAIFKADLAAVGLAKAVVRFNDDLIDLDNMVMNYQSGIKSLVLIGKIHLFNNNKRKNSDGVSMLFLLCRFLAWFNGVGI